MPDYAEQRRKTRSGAKNEAMRRLWDMAREGVLMRSRMGVRELSYSTDLVPGTTSVTLTADVHGVTIEVEGHDWADSTTAFAPAPPDPTTYRLDEAWLLDRTPPDQG